MQALSCSVWTEGLVCICRLAVKATQGPHLPAVLVLVSPLEALDLSPLSLLVPQRLALGLPAPLPLARPSQCQHLELPPHLLSAHLALVVAPLPLVKAPPQPLVKPAPQLLGSRQPSAPSPLQLLDRLEAHLAHHRAHQPLELLQHQTHLDSPHLPLAGAAVALGLVHLSRAPQALALLRARQLLAAQALEGSARAVLLLLLGLPQLLALGSSSRSSKVHLPSLSAQAVALVLPSRHQALLRLHQLQALVPLHPALAAAACLAITSRVYRSQADLGHLAGLGSPVLLGLVPPAPQPLVRPNPLTSLGPLHSRALALAACLGSPLQLLALEALGSLHSSSSSHHNSRHSHSISWCQ